MNGMNVTPGPEPGMTPMAMDWKDRLNYHLEKSYAESMVPKLRDPQVLEQENTLVVDPAKQRMNTALWGVTSMLPSPTPKAPARQQGMASPKALRMERLEKQKFLGNAADPYIAQFFKQGLWHGGPDTPIESWKPGSSGTGSWGDEPTAISTSLSRDISRGFGSKLYRVSPRFYPHEVLPPYSSDSHSAVLRAYETAIMRWAQRYPADAVRFLQDPNFYRNTGSATNRQFANEMATAIQELGFKGIAYPPYRFGEWELAILDPLKNAQFYPVADPQLGRNRMYVSEVHRGDTKDHAVAWPQAWQRRLSLPAGPAPLNDEGRHSGLTHIYQKNPGAMEQYRVEALKQAEKLAPKKTQVQGYGPKKAFVPEAGKSGQAYLGTTEAQEASEFYTKLYTTFGYKGATDWWYTGTLTQAGKAEVLPAQKWPLWDPYSYYADYVHLAKENKATVLSKDDWWTLKHDYLKQTEKDPITFEEYLFPFGSGKKQPLEPTAFDEVLSKALEKKKSEGVPTVTTFGKVVKEAENKKLLKDAYATYVKMVKNSGGNPMTYEAFVDWNTKKGAK